MTQKEVYRSNIIQQVNDGLITQVKAAEILGLTNLRYGTCLGPSKEKDPKAVGASLFWMTVCARLRQFFPFNCIILGFGAVLGGGG